MKKELRIFFFFGPLKAAIWAQPRLFTYWLKVYEPHAKRGCFFPREKIAVFTMYLSQDFFLPDLNQIIKMLGTQRPTKMEWSLKPKGLSPQTSKSDRVKPGRLLLAVQSRVPLSFFSPPAVSPVTPSHTKIESCGRTGVGEEGAEMSTEELGKGEKKTPTFSLKKFSVGTYIF